MANFQPLDSGSQGCGGRNVLFLDASAPYADLMEAAEWRLGAVRELLFTLSTCKAEEGHPRDIPNVARPLLLLVEDAEALFLAARRVAQA